MSELHGPQPGTKDRPPAYHVMTLAADETVISDIPVPATGDEQAMAMARQLANGHAVDLWDGLRFIERFDPKAGLESP